ncbi:sugar-binding transcriptional regulator [Moorella naiadis]|uniref:sugar-binding transcriptional regulator n=1 Tax=Moorella naiadis (nom. illeg.) TaxID=3093670 RepID=UPI003D9CB6D8
MPRDDVQLLTKICHFYYNEDLTQSQIAERLGITRQMVSRLLQRAKQEGLVQIQINSPATSLADLEYKLEEKYGLAKAIVIKNDYISLDNMKQKLGMAAAEYLKKQLAPGLKIGVGWGTTLYAMAESFNKSIRSAYNDIKVIQLMGGLNNVTTNFLAQDIVRLIADSITAQEYYLHAPCIVDSRQVRDTFINEGIIKEVIDLYNDLDIVFIGIGVPDEDALVVKCGSIDAGEIKKLHQAGAVGEICLHYYNAQGEFLNERIVDRVIGISVEHLQKARKLVAVGGGESKKESVQGVLKSGLLNVLITDESVARYVI